MIERSSLYDQDFFRWSREQAAAVRAAARSGTNLPLDWENIAEEIQSLGRSDRRELRNRTRTLIRHLLKMECSPSDPPKRGCANTIRRTRSKIDDIVRDSPSLRSERAETLSEVLMDEAELTATELDEAGQTAAAADVRSKAASYSADKVFGDWLPKRKADEPS